MNPTATAAAAAADTTTVETHGPRITVKGALALFAARLLALPPGEYVIHLDKTHPTRPRWRIATPGPWEKAAREGPE